MQTQLVFAFSIFVVGPEILAFDCTVGPYSTTPEKIELRDSVNHCSADGTCRLIGLLSHQKTAIQANLEMKSCGKEKSTFSIDNGRMVGVIRNCLDAQEISSETQNRVCKKTKDLSGKQEIFVCIDEKDHLIYSLSFPAGSKSFRNGRFWVDRIDTSESVWANQLTCR